MLRPFMIGDSVSLTGATVRATERVGLERFARRSATGWRAACTAEGAAETAA